MSVHSLPTLVRGDKAKGARELDEPRWTTLVRQEKRDLCSVSLWRGAFAEFVGTGLLCIFTIGFGMTPEGGTPPTVLQVSLAVGFFIGIIITTFGKVSGGHVNPAISVALFVTGHCTLVRFVVYSAFQVMGAVTGTGLLKFMAPSSHLGSLGLILPGPEITDSQAIASETLISFFLIFITVAMIDPGRSDVQGSIPLMVGLAVSVNIFYAHTLSGACMNPARAMGPAIVTGKWDRQWIYWLGPMVGALIGAVAYDIIFSAKPICSKRFCNPLDYGTYGDDNDDDDDENTTSDSKPLRNGKRRFDDESKI